MSESFIMGDEEIRRKLNDMHEKLIALHVVICGHDGLGGLQREFTEVKREIEEVKAFRVKVATISSMIGAACGAVVTWIAAWIKSKNGG